MRRRPHPPIKISSPQAHQRGGLFGRRRESLNEDETTSPRRSSRGFSIRFDRLRRRPGAGGAAPPTPMPGGGAADWFDRDVGGGGGGSPLAMKVMSRREYIRELGERMAQLDRVPTRSFSNSYAGEFDVSCDFLYTFSNSTPMREQT